MIKTTATIVSTVIICLAGYFSTLYFLENLTVPQTTVEVTPDTKPKKVIYQDPKLLSQLESLGATYTSDLGLSYDDPNAVPSQKGSYRNKVLTVESSVSDEEEIRTLAHEYLHHVWYQVLSIEKRIDLTVKLETLLQGDKGMQSRVKLYVERDILNASELFSIYCTESTDSYMLSVVDECNKYIDRTKLVLTR